MKKNIDKKSSELQRRYPIFEEIKNYIMKNIIEGSPSSIKTITLYRTDFYDIFFKYSKIDIDICLDAFLEGYHLSQHDKLMRGYHNSTNIEKIKIKNRKGWFF